jgi:hypothetical protein
VFTQPDETDLPEASDEYVTVPGQGYWTTQRYGVFGRRSRRVWQAGEPVRMLRAEAEEGEYRILEDEPAEELYSEGNLTWFRSS